MFNFLLDSFPIDKKIIKQSVTQNKGFDIASIILEYPEATGTIQSNWITPIKIRKLIVTGTKGYCEVDYIKQKLTIFDIPPKIIMKCFFSLVSARKNANHPKYIQPSR